jgi:hypothetical protein
MVPADSGRWTIHASSHLSAGAWMETSTYWFKPGDARAWEALVLNTGSGNNVNPTIYAWDSVSAVIGPVYGQSREIPPHC